VPPGGGGGAVSVGKGFYCPGTAAAAASASGWEGQRGPADQRSYDEVKREAAHKVTTSIGGGHSSVKADPASTIPSTISILITKTDDAMFSVLRQLRAGDEAREQQHHGQQGEAAAGTRWFDEEMSF
jgi:hypothetical protein